MKQIALSLCPLVLFATLSGCAPDRTADSERETMTDTTHTMTLSGDFEGPLGLQLWSLREHLSDGVDAMLARTKAYGFTEVELAGTYGMKPATYRQMLDAAGLDATSMHSGYERFRDSLEVVLDEAEALGVDYLGIAWIPHERGKPFTNQMAREAAADFNRFGAGAKARGLRFFYHVHGYEYRPGADGRTPFDVMVDATDPETVEYEMDVFWVTHAGTDPAALLRKYPNRWRLMHIKDMKVDWPTGDYSGGTSEEADVPIGTGQINWSEVLAAAEEIGLEKYYIEDESTDPIGNIPKSVAFLETVTF